MKRFIHDLGAFALMLMLALPAMAADQPAPSQILFTNVHVFDGVNEKRIENANVLVEGDLIKQVSTTPISAPGATVIDGGGRTLTPEFIDAHTHIMVNEPFEPLIYDRTQVHVGALATVNAKAMLHRGFTTIHDMGGPSQGLKDVIDKDLIEGPRIPPSGSFISQSSGHGDFDPRMTYLSPHFAGHVDRAAIFGWTLIADGVPEVMFAFSAAAEIAGFSGETAVKDNEAKAGAEAGFKRAKQYGLKMAWGTDTFGSLEDISMLGDPEKNLKMIMKNGTIYNNTLS